MNRRTTAWIDGPRIWVFALILLGVALRACLWSAYQPSTYPDTGTYVSAARDLLEGGLTRSQGRRTPGYPLLVALVGAQAAPIVLLQMLGGILTSVLLFRIGFGLTGSGLLAFLAGAAYDLNFQQLFLESALLSESLSTLTVVAFTAACLSALERARDGRPALGYLVAAGVLAGSAILVRPQFVFLLALLPLLVLYAARRHGAARALARAAVAALPAFGMALGWAAYVHDKTGNFALTTQSGFSLVNHSVAFVELAPPGNEKIRDILLKYREIKLREQGNFGNTGWLALPELQRATGMSIPELSRELQRLSVQLFAAHPILYARSVFRSWIDFWTVPLIWDPANAVSRSMIAVVNALWPVEQFLLRFANVLFVLSVALAIVSGGFRRAVQWDLPLSSICALVLLSSLVQALADYGASSRYLVTVQALVVLVVLALAFRWTRSRVPTVVPAVAHTSG